MRYHVRDCFCFPARSIMLHLIVDGSLYESFWLSCDIYYTLSFFNVSRLHILIVPSDGFSSIHTYLSIHRLKLKTILISFRVRALIHISLKTWIIHQEFVLLRSFYLHDYSTREIEDLLRVVLHAYDGMQGRAYYGYF